MGSVVSFVKQLWKGNSDQTQAKARPSTVNSGDTILKISEDEFTKLAFGCILGAMCGDAIGVPVEFETNVIKPEKARACLTFPGGGPFGLGPGQVTDDSELALCLAEGLVQGKGVLDLDKIGAMYHKWYLSPPFDIGITTRTAFKNARTVGSGSHAKVIRESALKSHTSQSNGGLMRITPLCVWTSKLSREEIIRAVREETRLTHSNETAQNVSIAYVYTINYLLNHSGEYEQAYQKCKEIVNELNDQDIKSWLSELEKGILPPAHEKMGWVKIAFLYSLHYLRRNAGYEEAMFEMVIQGGDTDTNCCIVGGMIGALHGLGGEKGVPELLANQLLSFDASKDGGIERDDYLVPGKVAEDLINQIIEMRPELLKLKGEWTREEIAAHL